MAVRRTVKTTFNMRPDALEMAKAIAAKRGITVTAVIHAAIQAEHLLSETEAAGGKVLIESADGTVSRLIFR